MTRMYRPLLERLDLTYTQYVVMLALWEADGVLVSELGERMALDSGTLTPLLKRLEAKGLVERHRGAEDERTVSIALTGKGRTLKRKARSVPEEMLCRVGLELKELQRLKALCDTLTHHLTPLP